MASTTNVTSTGKRGLCMNLGNCGNANQQKVLDIGIGEDFVCPECHKSLIVHNPRTGPSGAVLALAGVLLVVALAGVGWWLYGRNSEATAWAPPAPAVADPPVAATPAGRCQGACPRPGGRHPLGSLAPVWLQR